jgi:cytochrome P450
MGFGHGLHYSLGAALARAEARIGWRSLVERFPELRLDVDRVAWSGSVIGRGVSPLPVATERA